MDPATSYGSLCGSSQCNSLSASSQRWSPLWIQPLLAPLVDRAIDCALCRSNQCSFLVHPASAGPLIVCSRCWSPHSVYAASAGPLVDPASDCPLCGSSQCNSLSESSQRWSPLWIQPLLVPLVDRASDCPLCGSSQCNSLSESSQRWSPLWIQPLLVPLVDPASDCPLCGSSQCSLMLY